MKILIVGMFAVLSLAAQSDSVTGAYQRGVELGNQQNAVLVQCLSNPNCIASLREAQAKKDEAKAEKARLKAEVQARKDSAKAEKERQKTEIKLAKLRLQTTLAEAKRESSDKSANH